MSNNYLYGIQLSFGEIIKIAYDYNIDGNNDEILDITGWHKPIKEDEILKCKTIGEVIELYLSLDNKNNLLRNNCIDIIINYEYIEEYETSVVLNDINFQLYRFPESHICNGITEEYCLAYPIPGTSIQGIIKPIPKDFEFKPLDRGLKEVSDKTPQIFGIVEDY